MRTLPHELRDEDAGTQPCWFRRSAECGKAMAQRVMTRESA